MPAAARRDAGSSSLTDRSFGKSARLTAKADFDRVFADGKKFVAPDVIIWVRGREPEGKAAGPRLGLSVSRKVGGAVRRNRLKRLLREAFRLQKHRIEPRVDLVVYPRPACKWRGLTDAEGALTKLFQKAGIVTR